MGLHKKKAVIRINNLQLAPIPFFPILIKINHYGNHPIVPVFKLIQMSCVMTSGRVMGQVKLISGQTQITIPIEHVQGFIHQVPKCTELFIPFSVKPMRKVTPDCSFYLIFPV